MEISEHDCFSYSYNESYRKDLNLISWCAPPEKDFGYYASYNIGAEWLNDSYTESVVVTPKIKDINFLEMFMTCFNSDADIDSFNDIYHVYLSEPEIEASSLTSVLSPLIILHFIGIVNRIRHLKKGYTSREENIRKIKGRLKPLNNERLNIIPKKYNKIYCSFDEYSVDIAENRLIKKALQFCKRIIMSGQFSATSKGISESIARLLSRFSGIGDEINIYQIYKIKHNKLFKEYKEAIRLAEIILKLYDFSISNISIKKTKVLPFVLDMSLLFEHYVYGLLNKAYGSKIKYQYKGITGIPDFLYSSSSFKAILDAKYMPKFNQTPLIRDIEIIRQLSGYCRDINILSELGFNVDVDTSQIPVIPCVILYPDKNYISKQYNPFFNKKLIDILDQDKNLLKFYKIPIPIPKLTIVQS